MEKPTRNKVKKEKRLSEMYSCILSNSSDGFVACFGTWPPPIRTESRSGVALWYISFISAHWSAETQDLCNGLDFEEHYLKPEVVCASKTDFYFAGEEFIIS